MWSWGLYFVRGFGGGTEEVEGVVWGFSITDRSLVEGLDWEGGFRWRVGDWMFLEVGMDIGEAKAGVESIFTFYCSTTRPEGNRIKPEVRE